MDQFQEKTIHRKTIFKGRIINLFLDKVLLPNGNTSTRELIEHPGAVAVIAITDEGKMLMVEQYRKALEDTLIEIPAGLLEKNEKPEEAAKRELEEETGYTCTELEHLTTFYTSPGFSDELLHIYLAKGLKLDSELNLDEDEFVEVKEVSFEEAEQFIKDKKIYDAKTVYAILYWKLLIGMEKK